VACFACLLLLIATVFSQPVSAQLPPPVFLDSIAHEFESPAEPTKPVTDTDPIYQDLINRIEQLEQQVKTDPVSTRHAIDGECPNGIAGCQDPLHVKSATGKSATGKFVTGKFVTGKFVTGKSEKPTFHIGGRIHADQLLFPESDPAIGFFENPVSSDPNFGNDPDNAYLFRRIRLEMAGDLSESMFWRMQIDFAELDTIAMKDVYAGLKGLPWNQKLIAGHQKRPIGLDHLNSSRFNVFIERPLYDNEGQSYFHWGISGMFGFPDGERSADVVNPNQARFRTRPEARSVLRWFDTGRITGAEQFQILGLEGIYNAGPLQFVGEYQFNWLQRESFAGSRDTDLFFHGAYAYVSYFLTGEHIPYNRESGTIGRVKPFHPLNLVSSDPDAGWGAWQVAYRFSYLDISDEDILGGTGHTHTFGMNWWMTSHSRLQFNLIYGSVRDRASVSGNTAGDFLILGTRLAVDF